MDPQEPRRADREEIAKDPQEQLGRLLELLETLPLDELVDRWPFDFGSSKVAAEFFQQVVVPLRSGAIDAEEAKSRGTKLNARLAQGPATKPPPVDDGRPIPPTIPMSPQGGGARRPPPLPASNRACETTAAPAAHAAAAKDAPADQPAAAQPSANPPAAAQPEAERQNADQPNEAQAPAAPPAPIKAQWQNIDPPRDDPDYVPNEAQQVGEVNDWKVVGASVRGKSHAHKGTFRDDAFGFAQCGGWSLVAVSDGAGSSPLSRVASQIACDRALNSLGKTLANYTLAAPPGDMEKLNADLTRLRSFLVAAAGEAQGDVLREVARRELQVRDMYATLLVMVHTKWDEHEIVAALQIGDGAIGVLFETDSGELDCTVLGDADHGEYSSETRFLTTPGIEREFAGRVKFTVKSRVRCIGVMSDGVSDDFFPEEKRLVQLFCGAPIEVEGMVSSKGEPVPGVLQGILKPGNAAENGLGAALVEWLQYEKRGSFDDRTLVLLHRSTA